MVNREWRTANGPLFGFRVYKGTLSLGLPRCDLISGTSHIHVVCREWRKDISDCYTYWFSVGKKGIIHPLCVWEFPKVRATIVGVPIRRTIVFVVYIGVSLFKETLIYIYT